MPVVLIGCRHIDFVSRLFSFLGKRTDDVIGFKSGDFQHRDIHCLQDLLNNRNRFPDIFRSLRTLRFVLLVRLMPEGSPGRIKCHTKMGRVDFLDQIL